MPRQDAPRRPLIKLFIAMQCRHVRTGINNYYAPACLISAIAYGMFVTPPRDRLNFTPTGFKTSISTAKLSTCRFAPAADSICTRETEYKGKSIYWRNNSVDSNFLLTSLAK